MRPRSLFVPLLLIGIGTLSLFRVFYPELRMVHMWPLVLILLGVVKLAERVRP